MNAQPQLPVVADAPPYASFFGSMGSAAAIIFTGITM